MRVYVGLGSNLGDREANLRSALDALASEPGIAVATVSSFRDTDPVGLEEQPRFINAAAVLETDLEPRALLERLLAVERRLGRTREGPRFGPRTIDLDLLRLRRGAHRRARARGAAPPAARTEVRARAARRARTGPRRSRSRPGGRIARGARLISMSHLDELDEFEAELELRLKKEYTAVFGLFRYCVLTQDVTYLCNKLDLQYVPQPSYPFFHVKMEDVWVWDKNRPTRMIPRAEIYTSGDVTVEELRGEGDEPKLTAEALAEKIGESLQRDDDTL